MQHSLKNEKPLFFDAHVSQFEGIKPYPLQTQVTVNQVVEYISTDRRLQSDITTSRTLLRDELKANKRDEKGKLLLEEYTSAKIKLPGVTWAGTFAKRTNTTLLAFSGFLSFDIDFIDKTSLNEISFDEERNKALAAYNILKKDKFSALLFGSVSGTGVKGLVKIPHVSSDAEYKTYFRAYSQYLEETYQITLDSLPDISRLCFLSYQETPYVNRDSAIFSSRMPDPLPLLSYGAQAKTPQTNKDPSVRAALSVLKRYGIGETLSRNEFVGMCGAFKRTQISYETFDHIMQKSPGYNPKENFKIWNTVDQNEPRPQGKTALSVINLARKIDKQMFLDVRKDLKKNPDTGQEKSVGEATLLKRKLASKYSFKLNCVSDQIIVNTEGETWALTDFIESEIRCWLLDNNFKRREAITDVIRATAYQHRFHPIEDFFRGLEWDKVDRFQEIKNFFFDDDEIFPYIFKAWCVGAVRRVFTGQHHQVLIFAGEQGKGKSFFGRWLCPLPEYHLEQSIKPDTNDAQIRLSENFIWEVVEFGSTTRKSDIDALKNFISQEQPTYRRSHDKYDQKKKALASFIGTVNLDGGGFLNDPTGHRRWWPVELKHINFEYTDKIDLRQLWAQAYFMFQNDCHAACQIPDEIQKQINKNIESEFEARNPMEDLILRVFEFTGKETHFLDTTQILVELANEGYQRTTQTGDAMILSKALRLLQRRGLPIIKARQHKTKGPRGYLGIRRVSDDD